MGRNLVDSRSAGGGVAERLEREGARDTVGLAFAGAGFVAPDLEAMVVDLETTGIFSMRILGGAGLIAELDLLPQRDMAQNGTAF